MPEARGHDGCTSRAEVDNVSKILAVATAHGCVRCLLIFECVYICSIMLYWFRLLAYVHLIYQFYTIIRSVHSFQTHRLRKNSQRHFCLFWSAASCFYLFSTCRNSISFPSITSLTLLFFILVQHRKSRARCQIHFWMSWLASPFLFIASLVHLFQFVFLTHLILHAYFILNLTNVILASGYLSTIRLCRCFPCSM